MRTGMKSISHPTGGFVGIPKIVSFPHPGSFPIAPASVLASLSPEPSFLPLENCLGGSASCLSCATLLGCLAKVFYLQLSHDQCMTATRDGFQGKTKTKARPVVLGPFSSVIPNLKSELDA